MKKALDAKGVACNLLHSRFTYEDRATKENDEDTGILNTKKGIWITTQVVEASVDIDFDVLITEVSTMDSQVQRWGRIWRKKDKSPYKTKKPNIYITRDFSDDGSIYDKEIVARTIAVLESLKNKPISDADAANMFNDVFSNKSIEDTKYLDLFRKSLDYLDIGYNARSKKEAQKLFRDINTVSIIPKTIYEENKKEIDDYIDVMHQDDKANRMRSILYLNQKKVSVPCTWKNLDVEALEEQYGILVGNVDYSFEFGAEKKI